MNTLSIFPFLSVTLLIIISIYIYFRVKDNHNKSLLFAYILFVNLFLILIDIFIGIK